MAHQDYKQRAEDNARELLRFQAFMDWLIFSFVVGVLVGLFIGGGA